MAITVEWRIVDALAVTQRDFRLACTIHQYHHDHCGDNGCHRFANDLHRHAVIVVGAIVADAGGPYTWDHARSQQTRDEDGAMGS